MTPDMVSFHQIISELQAAEDAMLEFNQNAFQEMKGLMGRFEALQKSSESTDFDAESKYSIVKVVLFSFVVFAAYCENWCSLTRKFMVNLEKSASMCENYLGKVAAEENMSKKIKQQVRKA